MNPPNVGSMESDVDLSRALRALSHTTRRRVLILVMSDNPREQGDIAAMMVEVTEADEETVPTALHHTDLPQLDDFGFIDWDRDSGTVARGERFENIRPLLELMDDHREELPRMATDPR